MKYAHYAHLWTKITNLVILGNQIWPSDIKITSISELNQLLGLRQIGWNRIICENSAIRINRLNF